MVGKQQQKTHFFEHKMKRLTLVETLSKFYLTTLIYDFEKTNQTHVSATSTIILITKNFSLPLFYFLYLPVSISCIKSTICILPEGIFCPSQSPCNKVTLECCPQPPKKKLYLNIFTRQCYKFFSDLAGLMQHPAVRNLTMITFIASLSDKSLS